MLKKAIVNSRVYTVDTDNKWAEAVIMEGDTITFVGDNKEAENLIDSETQVIDGAGRLVLPGFIDNHCHPTAYCYKVGTVDLLECGTIDEYQKAIKEYIEKNPELEVIKGIGWFYADFKDGTPHKKDLDVIVSDKPVMLYSGDMHALWLNSKSLEMAEITKDTSDPFGGIIHKDENGEPTGYLNETPAVKLAESKISSFSNEDIKSGILHFMDLANKVGITSIHDAGIISEIGLEGYRLIGESEYKLRVFLNKIINPGSKKSIEEQVDEVEEYKTVENEFCKTNNVKLFMDGVPEANTAMLEEDYLNEPGNKGLPQFDLKVFEDLCVESDKRGYQIHVHAIGDRAVKSTIDSFEKAYKLNGKRDGRHIIAHVQLIKEDQIKRVKENGITIVPTASWFEKGDMYYEVEVHNLGKERADSEYKMKTFFDRGINVACGSDTPVGIGVPVTEIPFSPFVAIQQGITRCNPLKDSNNIENVLNPEERVSLEQMISAFTINCAEANFAEDCIGSLKVGKKADMIVLNQNLFEIPSSEIYKTIVDYTIFNGEIIIGL